MHFMTIRTLSWCVALLFLGCSPAGESPAVWRYEDGERVVAAADSGAVVVLAMDPSEVFTCSAMLMQWLEWRRGQPERFRLVFTRAPSPAERRRLRAVRLPLAGVLANGPRSGTPMEVVIRGGRVIFADRGVTTSRGSTLLSGLQEGSLDDVLPARSPGAPPLPHR